MAYGLLLYKQIEAPEGVHRLEVYKDGFTGDAVEIDSLVKDSITISKNGSSVTDPIVTSVLTFALYDTGQIDYTQFFTPNATLFKVVYKMDGSTRWTGFITPDSYSENLASHDVITLTARDNLGRLNDYDFSLARGQMLSVRNVLLAGLQAAGVAMDTVFVTTKVATSPSTILAVDGLVNTSLFVGMTWHEACELMLSGLGLTLAWNDANRFEVRDIAQAPANTTDAFFVGKSGYRQIRPAWKNLTVEQDYGLRESFYEGQFSVDDCGGAATLQRETFTPPSGHRWAMTGNFPLLIPYYGIDDPAESIFPLIGGADNMDDYLTYAQYITETKRSVDLSFKCSNCYWLWGVRRNVMWNIAPFPDSHQSTSHIDGYTLRFRFNVFLTYGGTKYVLRESWQVYDPSTIDEPYLSFLMPWTREKTSMEDVCISMNSIPADGLLEFVMYKPLIYLFNGDSIPVTPAQPIYGRIADIKFSIGDATTGRRKDVAINAQHNVQDSLAFRVGQVPLLLGSYLHFLGGLFYTDSVHTPLHLFKRDENGDSYDLLELVGREYISYQNDNYNALSGTMKADTAFYFNKGVVFGEKSYRIVSASLAVLSNTLSVQMLQEEGEFDETDYSITEVDSSGKTSTSGGSGSIGPGTSPTFDPSELESIVSYGLADIYARVNSLEDWLLNPSMDELELSSLNVAKQINLGGMVVEYDATNQAWHLIGSLYADGFITAGGLNTSGGGGGSIDLGAMWTSLCNQPIATADVTSTTKIALDHLPYTAGTGLNLSAAGAFSLAVTGVVAGSYGSVTVDEYGRVTAGSNSDDELAPVTEGIANIAARVASLEDWMLAPSFDEIEVRQMNVAGGINFNGVDILYEKAQTAWHLTGNLIVDGLVMSVDKLALAEGVAGLYARVSSLEDWLLDPAAESAYIAEFGAKNGTFGGNVDVYGTTTMLGLLTLVGGMKLTTAKQIWFSDTVYLEMDTNGYLHTNGNIYADGFVTAGGIGSSGGGGGGLDLGAMWTSLCNTVIQTADVTSTTKIAVDHIPDLTTTKITDIDAWFDAKAGSLDLSATELIFAEGYATVTSRIAALEDWMLEPTFDSVYAAELNAGVATFDRLDVIGATTLSGALAIGGNLVVTGGLTVGTTITMGGQQIAVTNGILYYASNPLFASFAYSGNDISIAIGGQTRTMDGTITLAGRTLKLGGSATQAQMLSDLGLSNAASDISTLKGYFNNNGSARWAARLENALSFGTKTYDGSSAQTITASDLGALTSHQSIYTLKIYNSAGGNILTYTPNSGSGSLILSKNYIGLDNVENTAISTWGGSSYITTVGTITSGTWHGSAISNSYLANSSITLAGRQVSLGGSISKANMLADLDLTNTNSNISTLQSYFTNGVANYANRDADGNAISSTYLKLSGGTMTGDIYMRGGNYGRRIWFGDGSYCYLGELTDDAMTLYGDKGVNLLTRDSSYAVSVGSSSVATPLTVYGRLNITANAYLEYNSSNAGIHASKGIYSDGYMTAGSTSSSSDARLKKNLRPVNLSVAQIANAPAVVFDWIDEYKGSGAGSIAQYWQEILPHNVRCFDEDGMLSMEYGNIALLAAITIAKNVETHEQKITRLERRVKSLETQLSNLKY